eukprot:Nk52_evm13s32 gene=Nk52_evmTU13s32
MSYQRYRFPKLRLGCSDGTGTAPPQEEEEEEEKGGLAAAVGSSGEGPSTSVTAKEASGVGEGSKGPAGAGMKGDNASESLVQLFNCFICMGTLDNAHMCPYCSKMSCEKCFKKWITEHKSECPCCRAPLLFSELVHCRWVEDVTRCIDTMGEAKGGQEGMEEEGGGEVAQRKGKGKMVMKKNKIANKKKQTDKAHQIMLSLYDSDGYGDGEENEDEDSGNRRSGNTELRSFSKYQSSSHSGYNNSSSELGYHRGRRPGGQQRRGDDENSQEGRRTGRGSLKKGKGVAARVREEEEEEERGGNSSLDSSMDPIDEFLERRYSGGSRGLPLNAGPASASSVSTVRKSQSNRKSARIHEDDCMEHLERVSVYCETCNLLICHKCALFKAEHKNHQFQSVDDIYNASMSSVNEQWIQLQARIKDFDSLGVQLDAEIEKLKLDKEERNLQLRTSLEQMMNRLDNELKDKLTSVLSCKTQLEEERELLEILAKEVSLQMRKCSQQQFVRRADSLTEMFTGIINKELPSVAREGGFDQLRKRVGIFSNEIVPDYVQGRFRIENFRNRCFKGSKGVMYSDVVETYGLQWRLKIYPNGNGVAKHTYLSVFIELHSGTDVVQEPVRCDYCIELVNFARLAQNRANGEGNSNSNGADSAGTISAGVDERRSPSRGAAGRMGINSSGNTSSGVFQRHHIDTTTGNVVREFSSDFEIGECWGYNRFYRLDILERDGYIGFSDVEETASSSVSEGNAQERCGFIEFVFSIRIPTYYLQSKLQDRHIQQLEKCIVKKGEEIEALKSSSIQRNSTSDQREADKENCNNHTNTGHSSLPDTSASGQLSIPFISKAPKRSENLLKQDDTKQPSAVNFNQSSSYNAVGASGEMRGDPREILTISPDTSDRSGSFQESNNRSIHERLCLEAHHSEDSIVSGSDSSSLFETFARVVGDGEHRSSFDCGSNMNSNSGNDFGMNSLSLLEMKGMCSSSSSCSLPASGPAAEPFQSETQEALNSNCNTPPDGKEALRVDENLLTEHRAFPPISSENEHGVGDNSLDCGSTHSTLKELLESQSHNLDEHIALPQSFGNTQPEDL